MQRGNNRQACFFAEVDYERYRSELRVIARQEGCAIHAYALMTNHVHLLVTPTASGQIAHLMQSLGRRYVRYFNDRYHRTGTLWEGRYKACPVGTAAYLLRCYRYIELNPMRAGMVCRPEDYRWSSYRSNALGLRDPLVQTHPAYIGLGTSTELRSATYRDYAMAAVDAEELDEIRLYLQGQYALGPRRFRNAIEKKVGRRAGPGRIGRPAKTG